MSSETSFGASYADAKSRLLSGKVQLLFVSPERVQSPRFQEMMAADGMPSIHFAVIDEVHCASEWKIGASRILAMTGTATELMVGRLCTMFGINMANNVVRGDAVRDNIKLSVVTVDVDARSLSRSSAREETLANLLRSNEMAKIGSVLVYVSTQASADRVAEYLTARSIPAQAYHAGKPASERARIQMAFMRKNRHAPHLAMEAHDRRHNSDVSIRVLVATVAFGMGLDKSDIRAVVHFNLPRSMEAYNRRVVYCS
ncbi:hypothetical protein GGH99_001331 [Coemansia sp. RSA 1285]|nr:hypothetical protein GGH99_001331 [Coemansia sp. RSA 1285]